MVAIDGACVRGHQMTAGTLSELNSTALDGRDEDDGQLGRETGDLRRALADDHIGVTDGITGTVGRSRATA